MSQYSDRFTALHLVLLLGLVAACAGPPLPTATPATAVSSATLPLSTAAPATATREIEATGEAKSVNHPLPVLNPTHEITPAMLTDAANTQLRDLIVFSCLAARPFPTLQIALAESKAAPIYPYPRVWSLWGVSPDGQRAGRLTDLGFAAYIP